MSVRAAASLLLALCAGCASRSADVQQRMILPAGAPRYEMADHQAFVFPAPRQNALPGFPPGALPEFLPPTTLCASLVVDAQGGVREIALMSGDPGCDDPLAAPVLGEAVREALAHWRFSPALFCSYPDAATRDRDWTGTGCAGAALDARPVAVSLAYAFTFEVRDGRPKVAVQASARD